MKKKGLFYLLEPVPLYLGSAVFLIAAVAFQIAGKGTTVTAYTADALALYFSCRAVPSLYRLWCKRIKPRLLSVKKIQKMADDAQYRTVLFTYGALGINVLYAVSKLVMGCLFSSLWFITLAGYYFILSLVRFMILRAERRGCRIVECEAKRLYELRICRNSAVLLFLLTGAVLAMIWLVIYRNEGHRYPGSIIYLAALFTFYKIIFASVNLHRTGKTGSILLASIRQINYADALVSVISLQTAMFASFSDGTTDIRLMNTLTGNAVCILILLMAVHMMRFSAKESRKIRF